MHCINYVLIVHWCFTTVGYSTWKSSSQ